MKDKFEGILEEGEKIVWVQDTNRKAYLLGGIVPVAIIFLIISVLALLSFIIHDDNVIPSNDSVIVKVLVLIILCLIISIINKMIESKNQYFAVTNKRIIKRKGLFSINHEHYSLKNIGSFSVSQSIWDEKGENGSGTIHIDVKSFHNNEHDTYINVRHINKVYDLYKLLSKVTNGNNENVRVKIED